MPEHVDGELGERVGGRQPARPIGERRADQQLPGHPLALLLDHRPDVAEVQLVDHRLQGDAPGERPGARVRPAGQGDRELDGRGVGGPQQQQPSLRPDHDVGGHRSLDVQDAVADPPGVHDGPEDVDEHAEPAGDRGGDDPDAVDQVTVGTTGPTRSGLADALRTLQPTGADGRPQLPGAGAPGAVPGVQLAGGDRGPEPRSLVVVQADLVGSCHVRSRHPRDRQIEHRAAGALLQPEPDAAGVDAWQVDVPEVGVAGQPQPVALPPDVVHPAAERQLALHPVDVVGDGQPRIVAERVVAEHLAPAADVSVLVDLSRLLEAQDLQQLGHQPAADQVPLQPVDRGQRCEDVAAGGVEEVVDQVQEQRPELLVGLVQQLQGVAEVLGRAQLVVPPLQLRLAAVAQELAGSEHRAVPVADRARLEPPLRDGVPALAPPVEVAGLRDDIDRGGHHVRRDRDADVLVQHARGEAEPVRVPERPAPELVGDDPVREQRGLPADMGRLRGGLERGLEHRGLPCLAGLAEPQHVAGGEVRTGGPQGADQLLQRAVRQDVVAVDEHQELARGGGGAGVACLAETGVGLGQHPEPFVTCGQLAGDLSASVGGPVVDDEDVEVGVGLLRDGLQAVRQVLLDVVRGDDHADLRLADDWASQERRSAYPALPLPPWLADAAGRPGVA